MATTASAVPPIILAGTINTINVFRETKSPTSAFNVIIANAGLLAATVTIAQFVSPDIARMLAILYLLGTVLVHGEPIVEWFSKLVSNTSKKG